MMAIESCRCLIEVSWGVMGAGRSRKRLLGTCLMILIPC